MLATGRAVQRFFLQLVIDSDVFEDFTASFMVGSKDLIDWENSPSLTCLQNVSALAFS